MSESHHFFHLWIKKGNVVTCSKFCGYCLKAIAADAKNNGEIEAGQCRGAMRRPGIHNGSHHCGGCSGIKSAGRSSKSKGPAIAGSLEATHSINRDVYSRLTWNRCCSSRNVWCLKTSATSPPSIRLMLSSSMVCKISL